MTTMTFSIVIRSSSLPNRLSDRRALVIDRANEMKRGLEGTGWLLDESSVSFQVAARTDAFVNLRASCAFYKPSPSEGA